MHLQRLSKNLFSRLTFFLYRIRVFLYLGILFPVWILNLKSGVPLISYTVFKGYGSFFSKVLAFTCGLIYLFGIILRMVGTAYIGGKSVWSGKISPGYLSQGPYGFLKHPIYQGSLLMLISLVPMCSAAGGAFLLVTGGGITFFLAIFEEKSLSEKYPTYKSDMERMPRFVSRKGYIHFLVTEGFRTVVEKWPTTVRSESFNLAFVAGFFAFAASFRTLYFWVSFVTTFAGLWCVLLPQARTTQHVDSSPKEG